MKLQKYSKYNIDHKTRELHDPPPPNNIVITGAPFWLADPAHI